MFALGVFTGAVLVLLVEAYIIYSLIIKDVKTMAQIIKTDGTKIDVTPQNGRDFQLSELQKVVCGYIETVNTIDGRLMIVNEEGKLKGLPINEEATKLIRNDVIVGDVLVCSRKQIR